MVTSGPLIDNKFGTERDILLSMIETCGPLPDYMDDKNEVRNGCQLS